MVITDNEIEKTETVAEKTGKFAVLGFFFPLIGIILCLVWKKDYPAHAKSAKKGAIIGLILGVIFAIGIGFLDDYSPTESVGIDELGYIKYGMEHNDAVEKMKANGWKYKDVSTRLSGTETLNTVYFNASDRNGVIEGEKVDFVGLGFNQESILVSIVLSYKIEDNSDERAKSILIKMLEEKGFKILAGPIRTQNYFEYWCQNADGNICSAYDAGTWLEIKYISKSFSNKMIDEFGGQEEFLQFLKRL